MFEYVALRRIGSGTTGAARILAGSATGNTGNADGQGKLALFNYPRGVAVDTTGVLYVTDTYNHMIKKISSSGA